MIEQRFTSANGVVITICKPAYAYGYGYKKPYLDQLPKGIVSTHDWWKKVKKKK